MTEFIGAPGAIRTPDLRINSLRNATYTALQTPTKLNQEQKDLLRKFAELRGEEIREHHDKGFFERVKDAFTGQ